MIMRERISRRVAGACSMSVFVLAATFIAPRAEAAGCPDPTTARGSQCVLDGDVTIGSAIVLDPGTHLNCQGHRILPTVAGRMTVAGNATPSSPRNAIVAFDPHGVSVRNCIIGDDHGTPDDIADDDLFQTGILLVGHASGSAGAPGARRNRIAANRTHATQFGVHGVAIRDTAIEDNDVFQGGIALVRDAKRVVIANNRVRALVVQQAASAGLFPSEGAYGIPVFQTGILAYTSALLPLVNGSIGGRPMQFPMRDSAIEDLTIVGNVVRMPAAASGRDLSGIRAQFVTRGIVAGNTVVMEGTTQANGNTSGIQFTGAVFASVLIPGTCSDNPERYCTVAADCAVSCIGTSTVTRFNRSGGTVIEDNDVRGDFFASANATGGIIFFERDGLLQGNIIVGQRRGHGIRLDGKNALETATVTRNSISNVQFGLHLRQGTGVGHADAFGAEVSLNDVVGSTSRAIRADFAGSPFPPIDIAVELSDGARGNYWSRTCADSEGFRASNEAPPVDTISPLVTDSHPYGAPVAGVFDETLLDQTCK
jgi:hypothetical protein